MQVLRKWKEEIEELYWNWNDDVDDGAMVLLVEWTMINYLISF